MLALSACRPASLPSPIDRLTSGDVLLPEAVELLDRLENLKSAPYAPLVRPAGIAVLPDARWFLVDHGAARVHRFDGEHEYLGELDEVGAAPAPLDLAAHGLLLLVLDANNSRVSRYTGDGVYRDVLLDLVSLQRRGRIQATAIAADRDGRIAIADAANHQVLVTGPFLGLETVVGEWGSFDGQFQEPLGVAFGRDGVLYVSDRGNRRVQAFDRTGFFLLASRSVDDVDPDLVLPAGIDCDRWGNVFVADAAAGEVVVFTPDLRVALRIGRELGDTRLQRPVDCALGTDDRLYVSDAGRNAVVVYQLFYP